MSSKRGFRAPRAGSNTRPQRFRAGLAWLTAAAVVFGPAIAAPAAAAEEERVLSLVGSLQDELGCEEDWQLDCQETALSPTGADGIYAAEFDVPEGSYEFKVVANGTWDESYGIDGGDANIPLSLAGPATLRFVFDDENKRPGIEVQDIRGEYTDADSALVSEPVRQAGSDEVFYFVMTDRFANGDESNDTASIDGDRLDHGFDPTDKGFFHGGDIAGLLEHLDYIEGLGTTAIWLTPSFENKPVQGEGADASAGYHGYWVTDFTRIDPHLGSNEELSELIAEAHKRDIKVYFDIITNHTADVIDYAEGEYDYIDMVTSPYLDAEGNAFDPAEYAGTDTFPELDAEESFPYTPIVTDPEAKTPDWLNDPTLYHNRGDSTWEGESVTYGDFMGLDDLMTEHPTVVNGFVEVYQDWIDLGIDGFRIDTVKHVNFEFWETWSEEVLAYAHAQGKDDFFMFGEVYDADPAKLSPYVRDTAMNSVLDFTFQSSAVSFAGGNSARGLSSLFRGDDYYTTPETSASALPTFLGNHDMGRIGHFVQNVGSPQERSELAHELMFLTRGQPVVYYGDEQGFAGTGGDKDARQTLFASQVDEYIDQLLITGEQAGSVDRYDTDVPLYEHIANLAQLRETYPELSDGAQIELYAEQGAGLYVFSRVDRDDKTEMLIAVNNSVDTASADVTSLTHGATYEGVYGTGDSVTSDADGTVSLAVPALSTVVLRADREVSSADIDLSIASPAPGAGLTGLAPVSADLGATAWAETSFSWRAVGSDEWTPLGVAETTSPRVFHDVRGLPAGTLIEYRAVATSADGQRSAASTYANVGHSVSLDEEPAEHSDIESVSVPGDHNVHMGCASDWAPGCAAAELTLRGDGIYEGTFDNIPEGDYEYKAAINGAWDWNYGANGVLDGPNATYSHAGGPITFYFDPRSGVVQTTADGPIVTLAGSFQSQVGCDGDWDPACLGSIMHDGDRDGVYEFTTDRIAEGSYEVKVTHGMSWDENYGAGGAPGGDNYAFSVADGEPVTFRYTLETNLLEIAAEGAAIVGGGELRAHWIDETTIVWPAGFGAPADGATWELFASETAELAVVDGAVTGGDPVALSVIDGGLTDAQSERFPALAGATALRVDGLDRATIADTLSGQVAVAQYDAGGELRAFTGVQLPGVLDDLYADAAANADLGVSFASDDSLVASFTGGAPSFRVWAPTAQDVTLLTWEPGAAGDPTRHAATFDEESGVWGAVPFGVTTGTEYLWEVSVYAHSTRRIETNIVSDPYAVALTTNSERAVVVDLSDEQLRPETWEQTPAPHIERDVDRAIYELHVRDFSISDESVPEDVRGTYLAFAEDSNGTRHLAELADAGITTVHLLPTFDIATIEEDRSAQAVPACDLAAMAPDSHEQQACIAEIRGDDGFNWGYDPYHFFAPEGSYATQPDGADRIVEFRTMVGALHETGLEVVLDKVYNHTAQSGQGERSVLDKVVPGYYHRLNQVGAVETSTCCENVATENALAEKLMVDAVVLWAREYRVDGFRFDLMGHHSRDNMLAVRAALDELELETDGVDGSSIYLYGEGWNFGEVADNALFEQATQGQLGGTGIGTFNDRLRDAVHGGSPVDSSSTFRQGFGTGLGTDPNGDAVNGTTEQALADLAHEADLVRLGLAGNLRDYELLASDGEMKRGEEFDYRGAAAGYAAEPGEIINYVDAHDNETLYDLAVLKLPVDTSMSDRVRMNALSQATVTLSQGVPFWHAGTELLRSKSLDRNSYDSGDWFNRIDWTGQENTFGSGLPPAWDNQSKWPAMAPLLADESLKPGPDAMADAKAAALDLLRLRGEVDLLRLGSAELISQKVSFPNSGPEQIAGVVVMHIDDLQGEPVSPEFDGALLVFNASPDTVTETIVELEGREYRLAQTQQDGWDDVVRETSFDAETGTVTVPARSVAVLVEDAPEVPGGEDADADANAEGTADGAGDGSDAEGTADGAADGSDADGAADGSDADGAADGSDAEGAADGSAAEGAADGGDAGAAAEDGADAASDGADTDARGTDASAEGAGAGTDGSDSHAESSGATTHAGSDADGSTGGSDSGAADGSGADAQGSDQPDELSPTGGTPVWPAAIAILMLLAGATALVVRHRARQRA
ncbi:pullulanase-type alpha-1,6-glucosidase [Microbacterium amylolyticum]|uniref:Pullulanase-type alpha-1,6-glucosidase n=1 Tax=Microbacterium amylolyticum TaxID=936337 RepID=A0ABS4ZG79_9MICO|nr:pullulanase-type alpha-1,6-glucosidase [Microbacterium amylolyticum]MBP2436285.1 pullulanase-type alpha-1,6-glucosidase [Microbacterium amylolyticum]